MRFLITGGSGYVGGELKRSLLADAHECVNIDIEHDDDAHPNLLSVQGNIAHHDILAKLFAEHGPFDAIYHAAAQLQLTRKSRPLFYATNIHATKLLADNAVKHGVKNFIFISSNCVYGKINGLNIHEDTTLSPFEEYGRTKVESEKILQCYHDKMNVVTLRPPTIIGEGRLGILSIVFDFIRENRKLWLIGNGENRYQFIYCQDLINACKKAAAYNKSATFNIGCDSIPTLNQLFQTVIDKTSSQSKIYHLFPLIFVPAMKLCFKLGLSPLGPYQYNMITNTFSGDTTKIKKELNWFPTKSNIEMLLDNYHYYVSHRDQILNNKNLTGHRKIAKTGILSLIKWLS
ncbi:MAG: NAD-dependent epimerase/dehydratase [uncultured bacterium]|nr:MAG: NAD-dependent epimerase/dehydratase [uncultured bacterium]